MDGFAQGGFRRAAQALLAEGDAQIILNLSTLRIELCRPAQSVEGLVIFLLPKLELTENRQAERVQRRQSKSLLDVLLGLVQTVAFELNGGQVGQCRGILVVLADYFQVFLLCFIQLPGGKVSFRFGHQCRRAGR